MNPPEDHSAPDAPRSRHVFRRYLRYAFAQRRANAPPQRMVRWFDPLLLVRTLLQVVVATLFGRYADRRARFAGGEARPARHDDADGLWLDWVADIGDGFDGTATIAGLLAQPQLPLGDETLPHGRVLVFGGDTMYPGASRQAAEERLELPYYALHPQSDEAQPRDLYAIPGNHDWFDGLATFTRLFCQGRWFAGWKTSQSRSYFVLRLPGGWWFVGVDVQLDNDVDTAQRDYLLAATREIAPGDAVILAAAVPWWLRAPEDKARRNMEYLARILVEARGARVRLKLSGDLHHYTRYDEPDGSAAVTSGGGGAFLHGTAFQPRVLDGGARLAKAWPDALRSRLALWRLPLFPLFNAPFSLLLGGVLMLLFWGLDAASHGTFFYNLSVRPAAGGAFALLEALPSAPLLTLGLFGWLLAAVLFADPPGPRGDLLHRVARGTVGTLHGLIHLVVALALLPHLMVTGWRLADPFAFLGMLLLGWLVLSLAAGVVFGVYLWLTWQVGGYHREQAFAACRSDGYRHFLRLHIGGDGTLRAWVIGVRRPCRDWQAFPGARADEASIGFGPGFRVARDIEQVDRFDIAR